MCWKLVHELSPMHSVVQITRKIILFFCESRMCTRSQCPRYKLQGISWVCFILYFSKQAGNTARRGCEVALQLTSATSGPIGGQVLFQWCSKNWWDNNWGTHIYAENSLLQWACLSRNIFSVSLCPIYILLLSQHYEGKKLFRNRQEIVELWTPFFVFKCHYIRFLLLVHKYVHISVQFFFQKVVFLAPEIISALKTQDLLLVITLENCW